MDVDQVLADRYELRARIGRGGMGEVFRAWDRQLERDVAVKVLPRHLVGDDAAERRFRREARAAAALNHPNVVGVHDAVTMRDVHAIVMELVAGPSLGELLSREGPVAPGRALALAEGIAEGLAAAHAAGLVHRDVKPSNVLLTADGTPKVADFGIARSLDASGTHTGLVRGSAPYLAPEQARGDPVDARTDVYALGALLFTLLTGRPPFDGEDALGIVHRHLHEPPPDPRDLADVGPAVAAAVLRALAKDPADRFDDPRDLVTAARRPDATAVLPTLPVTTRRPDESPDGRDGRRRRAAIATGVLAAVGLGVLAVVVGGPDDVPAITAQEVSPSATPSPSPSPAPTAATPPPSEPAPPADVTEAAASVRRTIQAQRSDGQLSSDAVDTLEERLGKVLEKDADGQPGKAAEELGKLREELDELVEEREATPAARDALAEPLAQLEDLLVDPDASRPGEGRGRDR